MVIEKLYHEDLPEEEAKKYQEKYWSVATLIENGSTLEKIAEQLGTSVGKMIGCKEPSENAPEKEKLRYGLRKENARQALERDPLEEK